ncbi:MAG: hypothetical protein A2018_02830 [Alphaproteobacteria bacterium GWF2_58_20]|nr:MAG: hypothetical protein A2018_02830 [Alphaproteobacteria bacterium GWF2_58_20]
MLDHQGRGRYVKNSHCGDRGCFGGLDGRKSNTAALLGLFLFSAPAMILSGFATPVENMPPSIQMLTQINPIKHFMVIVHGIFLKDMPFAVVWTYLWPIIAIGVATLTLATLMFRKKVA